MPVTCLLPAGSAFVGLQNPRQVIVVAGSSTPAPTGFAVTSQTTTSVSLEWTYGTDPTAFTLEFQEDGAGSWTDWSVLPSDRSATITGLTPNTLHQFRIKADDSSWVTTSGTTDVVEPAVFDSASSTTSTINITWTRSEDPTSYLITFRTAPVSGSPGEWQAGPEMTAADRGCEFTLPNTDTRYDLRVIAVVDGNQAAPMVTTQYTRPEAPTSGAITGSEAGGSINLTYSASGAVCDVMIYLDGGMIFSDTSNTDSVNLLGSYTVGQLIEAYVTRRSADWPSGLSSAQGYIDGSIAA